MSFQGIAWAAIFAEDFEKIVNFYHQTVGLPLVERQSNCVLLDAGAGSRFEIWRNGIAVATRKTPAQQSIMVGFKVDNIDTIMEQLHAKGVDPDGSVGQYKGDRWIHYVDPEGNRFEFTDVVK